MNEIGTSEHYDHIFKTQPLRWDGKIFDIDRIIKKVLEEKYEGKNIDVLELGCGNGRTIKFIKQPFILIRTCKDNI